MSTSKNYPLLLLGQFLGAFGDNLLLAAILAPLTFGLGSGEVTESYVGEQNALFSAVFFLPFILLAPVAGYLNDRMPKTTWLAGGNLLKLGGTLVGLAGLALFSDSFSASRHWLLACYAIVGVGACVYSPAKYGILPEVVAPERLVKANGTVEMLTLVAILGGLAGGAVLYDRTRSLTLSLGVAAAVYSIALLANGLMSRTPCNPQVRFSRTLGDFVSGLRTLVPHPRLGRILLGCCAFWFAGAAIRNNLQAWGLEVFKDSGVANASNEKLALLKVGLVLGIVGGSVLAGQLHKLGDLSWSRRYGLLMGGGILLMGLLGGSFGLVPAVVALLLTGLFAGLLIVPLNASLQAESRQDQLGKTVAIQNFMDYLGMLLGAGFLGLLVRLGLSPGSLFVSLAAATAVLSLALKLSSKKENS